MTKIRCLVVDDKPLAIDILREYISKIPFLELVLAVQNPLEALDYIYQQGGDLIFLDIQMPELNGIEFMKLLNNRCKVILSTAYSEYAMEGYEHDVVDYLLKPVSFDRFCKAAEKALKIIGITKRATENKIENAAYPVNWLFLKTDYKIQKILLDEILYIEAKQNYISVVTKSEKIMSLQNIKNIEDKLPPGKFIRVHKSYIVSLDKINTIERSRINIDNLMIPIGDIYRDAFLKRIGI
ncbi:MAG: LytTR family DNA-binding domain-containing protein, partial [Bacteroidota bacterium]